LKQVTCPAGRDRGRAVRWPGQVRDAELQASQKKVRDALLVLGSTLPDFKNAFVPKSERGRPRAALDRRGGGWGGNPPKDAIHLNVTPAKNDGTTVHKLNVKDVPVDGFWSMTVCAAQGYPQANPYNAYSLNNITAKKNDDGSFAIQFGGCDGVLRCKGEYNRTRCPGPQIRARHDFRDSGAKEQIISNCTTHFYGKMNAPATIEAVRELMAAKGGGGSDIGSLKQK
jgi:hypothetical protein